jgi:hypothetical protein
LVKWHDGSIFGNHLRLLRCAEVIVPWVSNAMFD